MLSMSSFWNGLNDFSHRAFIEGIVHKVNTFTKAGQVHVLSFIASPLHEIGLLCTCPTTRYVRIRRLGLVLEQPRHAPRDELVTHLLARARQPVAAAALLLRGAWCEL